MTGLESVDAALGISETISGIAKDVNNTELTRQVIDLQVRLLDVQRTVAEIHEENADLKDQLRAANQRNALEGRLRVEHHVYWLFDDQGKDGPFCTVCWDTAKKIVRLLPDSIYGLANCYICPADRTHFLNVPMESADVNQESRQYASDSALADQAVNSGPIA